MSQNERLGSKGYYVAFAVAGGSYVEISGDYTKYDWNGESDAADLTANNDDAAYELPLIKKYDYTMDAYYRGVAGTAVYAVLVEGTQGTIRWAPEGTTAGKPKGEAPCYVKSFKSSSGGKADAQTISIAWGPQGGLTSDPRTDVWP